MTKYKDIEGNLTRDKLVELDNDGYTFIGKYVKEMCRFDVKNDGTIGQFCKIYEYQLFKKEVNNGNNQRTKR